MQDKEVNFFTEMLNELADPRAKKKKPNRQRVPHASWLQSLKEARRKKRKRKIAKASKRRNR